MPLTSPDVASLDGLLNWWELAEYGAEGFVIVGCVGEFAAEFTKIKTEAWRQRLSKISLFVLIIALVFALIALIRTNGLSGQEIAILNRVAADAQTRASNADSTVKGFDAKIAEAERGTAEAQSIAESEKLERIKLEAAVAPRSLTLDQQQLIKVALARFSHHPQVIVSSYGLDGEAAAVGGQIITIIGSATGVAPQDLRASLISTGGFEFGIQIRGPKSESQFMSALATALTSIGKMKEVYVNGPSFRPGSTISGGATMFNSTLFGVSGGTVTANVPASGPVSIMIGVKPLPVLPVK